MSWSNDLQDLFASGLIVFVFVLVFGSSNWCLLACMLFLKLTNTLSVCVCISDATHVEHVFVAVCCCCGGSGVGSGRLNSK